MRVDGIPSKIKTVKIIPLVILPSPLSNPFLKKSFLLINLGIYWYFFLREYWTCWAKEIITTIYIFLLIKRGEGTHTCNDTTWCQKERHKPQRRSSYDTFRILFLAGCQPPLNTEEEEEDVSMAKWAGGRHDLREVRHKSRLRSLSHYFLLANNNHPRLNLWTSAITQLVWSLR